MYGRMTWITALMVALATGGATSVVADNGSDWQGSTAASVDKQTIEHATDLYTGASLADKPADNSRPPGLESNGRACLNPPDYHKELIPTTTWQTDGPVSLTDNDCYVYQIYMEPGFGYDFSCCVNDSVGGDADGDADFALYDSGGVELWYYDGPSSCDWDATTLGSTYELWEPSTADWYYLKVDDYYTVAMNYTLAYKKTEFLPCEVECPPEALPECEPVCYPDYEDVHNAGCNLDNPLFQAIECGDTICGTYGVYPHGTDTYRDTDWYHVVITEPSIITADVVAECDTWVGIGAPACPWQPLASTNELVPCEPISVSTPTWVPPGTYTVVVAPNDWEGCDCGAEYTLTVTCTPVTLGACCDSFGLCTEITAAECTSLGGTYKGDGTTCDTVTCPSCVECPPGATPENEPDCGFGGYDTVNGGCNSLPPVFGTIACDEIICGTAEAIDNGENIRDTDWYETTVTEWTELTWSAEAHFPVQINIISAGSGYCTDYTSLIYGLEDACVPASISACVPPGTYYLFIAPQFDNAVPCGASYVATLSCAPCAPAGSEYCEATSSNCDEWIGDIAVADLTNASGCDNYADFTALSATMEQGGSYPITVLNGGSPYASDLVNVWIDWNQDYSFSSAEKTALASADGGVTFTGTIAAPANATPGTTRMRVRMEYSSSVGPCGTSSWGEVEDYSVNVLTTPVLTFEPEQDCYRAGETVVVGIWMRGITEDISGGQFFLNYDSNYLALVSGTGAIVPGDAPITRQVFECSPAEQTGTCAGGVPGEIGYAVGATDEGDSVTGDWKLAVMTFAAVQDICDFDGLITWRSHDPPTRLTALPFGVVLPTLVGATATDTTPPTFITFPDHLLLDCDDQIPPADTGLVAAVDNCSTGIVITHEGDYFSGSGTTDDPFVVERTYRAIDHCGNYVERIQLIVVVDDVAPVITCPPDLSVQCDEPIDPAATGYATATDNCDNDVNITYSDEATCYGCGDYTGTITRTWTATDDAGNTDTCVQIIAVIDDTAPAITQQPTGQTVECDGTGIANQIASWLASNGGATATDNCGTVTWSNNFDAGNFVPDCGGTGYVDVVFTATDDCGNYTDSDVARFTIEDITSPDITCPGDAGPFNATAGTCTYEYDWAAATATDVCEGDLSGSIVYDIDELNDGSVDATITGTTYPFPVGLSKVTARVADDCGNPADCSFFVEVLGYNDLVVTVEVEGDIAPTGFTRCITFHFYADCVSGPVTIERDIDFTRRASDGYGVGTATFTLADGVPCNADEYTCVTAQDTYHTLTRAVVPTIDVSGAYVLAFTAADSTHLIQGDYYDDITLDGWATDYIDILDFGVWFNELGAPYPAADTPCGYTAPWHTNASGYGESDVTNYSFVGNHFLDTGEYCCTTLRAGQPRKSVTVEELIELGLEDLVRLDINRDGVFDLTDVNLLLNPQSSDADLDAEPDDSHDLQHDEPVEEPAHRGQTWEI